MPLDFPANPTNGQTYDNYLYDSSITAWRNVNSETGVVALNGMGLRTVVPTSVVVGSGSATTNANGVVTFTGASSVSLNGVFTSTYKNYRVLYRYYQATGTYVNMTMRVRASGTDLSTTSYAYAGFGSYSSGLSNVYTGGAGGPLVVESYATVESSAQMEFTNPQVSGIVTTFQTAANGHNGGGNDARFLYGVVQNTNSYDGLSCILSAGTGDGTIQVYGYTN